MGTLNNNLLPTATGLNLGSDNQRWDLFAQNIDVSGSINAVEGFYPVDFFATGGTGTSADPWTGWESSVNALASGSCAYFRNGYFSTTSGIIPANPAVTFMGTGWSSIISYSGTSYCFDINTQPKQYINSLQISLGTSALGGIRIQHITSNSEANNRTRNLLISGTWTSGQIGVLFYTTAAGDSNYHNDVEVQTLNIDIGAKFLSAVNTNGSNANRLKINCNGHSVGVWVADGTDMIVSAQILGCHGLTGGIGLKLGGGLYGCASSLFELMTEQGGTSTSVQYNAPCQLTYTYGITNDSTAISDLSGVSTNCNQFGAVNYNLILRNNALAFGGVASAASASLVRNGTKLEAKLGDQSAFTSFTATKLQGVINNVEVDSLSDTTLNLGSSSNLRHGQIWSDNTAGNIQTLALMSNCTTTDGTTFTAITSSYGSMACILGTNTTDSNSKCRWLYRNAGDPATTFTEVSTISNLGAGSFIGGLSANGKWIVDNTGLVTKYNNIATVGNGVPSVLAQVDSTNLGAAVGTTTLYATTGSWEYRLSWNAQVEVADGTSSTLGALTIVYTSPDGVTHTLTCAAQKPDGSIATTSTTNTTAAALLGLPVLLNAKTGTNITYAFAYTSNTPGQMKYNLHIKLECLG